LAREPGLRFGSSNGPCPGSRSSSPRASVPGDALEFERRGRVGPCRSSVPPRAPRRSAPGDAHGASSVPFPFPGFSDMRLSLSCFAALGIAVGGVAQTNNFLYNYASDGTQNALSFTDRHGIAGTEEGYAFKVFPHFCA